MYIQHTYTHIYVMNCRRLELKKTLQIPSNSRLQTGLSWKTALVGGQNQRLLWAHQGKVAATQRPLARGGGGGRYACAVHGCLCFTDLGADRRLSTCHDGLKTCLPGRMGMRRGHSVTLAVFKTLLPFHLKEKNVGKCVSPCPVT